MKGELDKMKIFLLLGSLNMVLAIALGAFGAHGLEGKVSERMIQNWQTGAHYHIIHALAIIVLGLIIAQYSGQSSLLTYAGWTLFAGVVFFSGSLYTMTLTGVKKLGMVTPIGGLLFIIGWILVAIFAVKHTNQ